MFTQTDPQPSMVQPMAMSAMSAIDMTQSLMEYKMEEVPKTQDQKLKTTPLGPSESSTPSISKPSLLSSIPVEKAKVQSPVIENTNVFAHLLKSVSEVPPKDDQIIKTISSILLKPQNPPIMSTLPSVEITPTFVRKDIKKEEDVNVNVNVNVPQLRCYCGKTLVLMMTAKMRSAVSCDICCEKVSGKVFHCPGGSSKEHLGGYDLCTKCADNQFDEKEDKKEVKVVAKKGSSTPHLLDLTHLAPEKEKNDDIMYPLLKPSAPPEPVDAPVAVPVEQPIPDVLIPYKNHKHSDQLLQLYEMGFEDVEINKRLLDTHEGNVGAVCQQYFDGNIRSKWQFK
jgi:hypothetical protein